MSSHATRRRLLQGLGSCLAIAAIAPGTALASAKKNIVKAIPSSGETIPVIGMGTWRTFNVGADPHLRSSRSKVLASFFDEGGTVIDCSPMYGSAAHVLGWALQRTAVPRNLFAAEKVWTQDGSATYEQLETQREDWNIDQIDLMQVHNLLAWEEHLPALQQMKRDGKIRYVGITTSHGRRHDDLEQVMKEEDLDFVQLTYNITHREVEQRLLPLARERNIAIIANRPFDGGYLIKRLKRDHQVPDWAKRELSCQTWAEYLLKFVVSHPSVTCAIPATSKVSHMRENMSAAKGMLPDTAMRQRMQRHVEQL